MIKVSVVLCVYNMENLIERAVRSVPVRDNLELIVVDDGSTDDTPVKLLTLKEERKDPNFILITLPENTGLGHARAEGMDAAIGEYMVFLDSDDYYLTDNFENAIQQLDGTDLVYYDLRVNNGNVWRLNEQTMNVYIGTTKFMRREFVGATRTPDIRFREDVPFWQELKAKKPTYKFTGLTVLHYNFPREGSLNDEFHKKERKHGDSRKH